MDASNFVHFGNTTSPLLLNGNVTMSGNFTASGHFYGAPDGFIVTSSAASLKGSETVFKVEHPETGSLMEVKATTDSGSILVSGSIFLKNNLKGPRKTPVFFNGQADRSAKVPKTLFLEEQ